MLMTHSYILQDSENMVCPILHLMFEVLCHLILSIGRTEAQDENASEIWEQLNPKWIQ